MDTKPTEEKKPEEKEERHKTPTLDDVKKKAGQKKRARGRPLGSTKAKKEAEEKAKVEAEAEPVFELDPEGTKALLEWMFNTAGERMGPWWPLKPEESEAGAKLVNAVVAKRAPMFAKYAEEIALGMWALGVVVPRYRLTQAALKKMEEEKAKTPGPLEEKATGEPSEASP
jgi:hypothetical protein